MFGCFQGQVQISFTVEQITELTQKKTKYVPVRPVTLPATREVKLSKSQRRPPSPFNTATASTPWPPRQKKDIKLCPLCHRLTFKKGRLSREDGSSIAVLRGVPAALWVARGHQRCSAGRGGGGHHHGTATPHRAQAALFNRPVPLLPCKNLCLYF